MTCCWGYGLLAEDGLHTNLSSSTLLGHTSPQEGFCRARTLLTQRSRVVQMMTHVCFSMGMAQEYNGFNMVVGDLCTMEIAYMTNRGEHQQPIPLQPGLHGISNGSSLQQEWAKVQRGKSILQGILGLETPSAFSKPAAHTGRTGSTSSSSFVPLDSVSSNTKCHRQAHCASSPEVQQSQRQEPANMTQDAHHHCLLPTEAELSSAGSIGNLIISSSVQPAQPDSQPDAQCEQQTSGQASQLHLHDSTGREAPTQPPAAARDRSSVAVPWNAIMTQLMQDSTATADDSQLPQTGMPEQIERNLSPIFIRQHAMPGGAYGTRTQTVIAAWHDGHMAMHESNLMPDGSWVQHKHDFARPEAY